MRWRFELQSQASLGPTYHAARLYVWGRLQSTLRAFSRTCSASIGTYEKDLGKSEFYAFPGLKLTEAFL